MARTISLPEISAVRIFKKSGRIEQLFTVQFHPKLNPTIQNFQMLSITKLCVHKEGTVSQ